MNIDFFISLDCKDDKTVNCIKSLLNVYVAAKKHIENLKGYIPDYEYKPLAYAIQKFEEYNEVMGS